MALMLQKAYMALKKLITIKVDKNTQNLALKFVI